MTDQSQSVTVARNARPELGYSADGSPIAYWRDGQGPAILIVHGSGTDHAVWDLVSSLLARSYTVIALDRRGRGASGDTPPYAFEREFDDVVAVVEGIGPMCVLGHSLGTPIALEAALLTRTISSLVLYEGWPEPDEDLTLLPDFLPALDELGAARRYQDMVEYGETPEDIEEMRRDRRWSSWLSAAAAVPREIRGIHRYWTEHPADSGRWRQLSIPILMLYGELNLGQKVGGAILASGLHEARVVELPGQGHWAYHEAPGLFAETVSTFLDSVRPGLGNEAT